MLLNGCGTGFYPEPGLLKGFITPIQEIYFAFVHNQSPSAEEKYDDQTKTWIISIGPSAQFWIKALKLLLSGKYPAKRLIFNLEKETKENKLFTYHHQNLIKSFKSIATLLSSRSGHFLTSVDILDIVNLLGIIPLSRRSSQIALFQFNDNNWIKALATRKANLLHRYVCNISVIFQNKPNNSDFELLFHTIKINDGCQPGIINGKNAIKRAAWFQGFDSCVTTLLPNKGVSTLSEINLLPFKNNFRLLKRAVYLTARMNYRQSFVKLNDGMLQNEWHTKNEELRLCGLGLTGVAAMKYFSARDFFILNKTANLAAEKLAKEFDSAIPKLMTCIKPSGNLSKIMGCLEWGEIPEGIHFSQSEYVFNRVIFSKNDPLLNAIKESNYEIQPHPLDTNSCLVKFPVRYHLTNSMRSESAIDQLEQYKKLQNNWADHNVSNTIFYRQKEIKAIIKWLDKNWDFCLGLSFNLLDNKINYPYIPQEGVKKDVFYKYCTDLKEIKVNYNDDRN
ncbi:MAG: hypothetical protein Tsb0021_14020 [Chlamydiales bacterium]